MRLSIFLSGCVLLASQVTTVPEDKLTSQEVFFLRRQTEFWKDRDYGLMKKQIAEFLASHETSNIHNNLHAMMGDILYQEGHYGEALAQYECVKEVALREKIVHRRWQCLYLEGEYDQIIQGIDGAEQNCEMQFILADSLFRKMRMVPDLELALRAKPLFLELFNTSYQDKTLLPLAEIHRELKEFKEAASLYLMLAAKDSSEEFLLQAAALQLEFDAGEATRTFAQVVDLGGERASDAAYHEMLLLFQNDQFSDLIERGPMIGAVLAEDKKGHLDFCLGRSYFKINLIPESINYLNCFVKGESENTAYKKAAFSMLIQCAKETDDQVLFDSVLDQFLSAFPGDEEAGNALLLHAQVALRKENLLQASNDLDQLLRDFPDFPTQETLLYDQAALLYKTEEWASSRMKFLAYLEKFPETPHKSLIYSSIVHCSIEELKNGTGSKEALVADLRLENNDSHQFLLGQLLFELGQFEKSAFELDQFCQKNPDHAEAQLIQALALREMGGEVQQFVFAAERALALLENSPHREALQLHLFNAYLSLEEYERAASTLYQTFMIDGFLIQQENQLWLAHYYLEKEQEKSVEIFRKILGVDESGRVCFDPDQTHFEKEALALAGLVSVSEREPLLTSLVEIQRGNTQLSWKNQDKALFELAKTLVELNQPEKALELLEELTAFSAPNSVLHAALLEKSRLLLSQCKKETDNSTLQLVLSTLKDLQIQKDLGGEPVHLEAAFDYADLRVALAAAESQTEVALFFLNRMKEDFSDLQYQEARLRFPEKDELFQVYMQCLEAEILCWESKEALEVGDKQQAEHKAQVAAALFEAVAQNEGSTKYLKSRVEEKLKNL